MMRSVFSILITLLVSDVIYSQAPVDQNIDKTQNGIQNPTRESEIFKHYQRYDIAGIRDIVNQMPSNLPGALGRLQNMLNTFYKDHPARPLDVEDLDLENSLKNQQDPLYKPDIQRRANIERLREKQSSRLIKNAPNIFELHLAMARGLRDAEKNGIIFTKNPFRSSFHFITALRYRTLKLTPEVWLEPDRLSLINDSKEKTDAENFRKVSTDLNNARLEFDQIRQSLYANEDNLIPQSKDPGNNPAYTANQSTLAALRNKIKLLEQEMEKQAVIYESYAEAWNRVSAGVLLEFADVVNAIDKTLRDKEKILESVEYYRSSYDSTFKQNWNLESRKMAYIDLLETASLLDPKNPNTPFLLAGEYKSAGDNLLAISSYEKSLLYNLNADNKLTEVQLSMVFLNLGGLYYSSRRYVDSVYYYERAFALNEINGNNADLEFQLAKIHAENTGNYDRARELFEDLNGKIIPADENSKPDLIAENLKSRYVLNSYLAYIYEKTGQGTLIMGALKKSASIHAEFENLILKNYDLLRNKEKIMVESRLKFNREPDENNMQAFYQAQQDYHDQKNIIQQIESMKKSINFQKTYFSLAGQYEMNHDIQSAIEAYRNAESLGIAPDEARREIMRLQKEYLN